MEELHTLYPCFFDENLKYIIGSIENKIERLKDELKQTDYIVLKYIEGEDISVYGNWQEKRHLIRNEINYLQTFIQ